jgi:ribosomal protein L7/L12
MADQPTDQQIEQITAALAAGRKIEAIKICREATGKGLKEAKDFTEALTAKLIEEDPERYAKLAKRQGGGCASVVALGVGLAAAWLMG